MTGVYDVTVGPLLQLWGFASHETLKDTVPAQADIDAARAKVGYQKLQVRLDPPRCVNHKQMSVWSWLRWRMVLLLIRQVCIWNRWGSTNTWLKWLVKSVPVATAREAMLGALPLKSRLTMGGSIQQGCGVTDAGLATSGDYRNFFVQGGKRYSHTMDTTTGYPVTHNLASVSVLAEEAVLADAYATLLLALGENKGKAFAEVHSISAYFIWRTDQGFETSATEGFRRQFG